LGILFNAWTISTFIKIDSGLNSAGINAVERALAGIGLLLMKITLPVAVLINYILGALTTLSYSETTKYGYYLASGLLFGLFGLAIVGFILRKRSAQQVTANK
jgi:ABC-type phosphate transport system permease subunit